jgi:hypothetical protein
MTDKDLEGMDFVSAFRDKFAAPERMQVRLQAERRAGRTPKQRARKAIRDEQVNFRASKETRALIGALAEHLDVSMADVMERALQELAKSLPDFGGKQ